MTLTILVLLVLVLYMVQIFLQETSRYEFSIRAIVGNRDNPPPMSVIAGRLDRAKTNLLEALPVFIALALLSLVRGGDMTEAIQGAEIFLVARVVYVPAYVSGVPWFRSLVWLTSNSGLLWMAWSLVHA